ncbi:hypothetical protein HLRTI_000438 [Halorhabdus tiamatea SARL4B]|uniref:DUF8160 domain-containing protein n=1 Tax=Halorhabdus tiamatea SARL4B TaxID=1033806 RepID=F7PMJ6_9EURY|nr:hypothetical protein [Halorhabdus tiamatea]ERJ07396.1 hypothetical protein HLRTI_000438 [Halorhabdus tiamatea SARL4B]
MSGEETDEGAEEEAEGKLPAVKERDTRVLAYLPDDISQRWGVAKATIQLEWNQNGDGSNLEKLRHIYPILMIEGIEDAMELSAEEIGEYKREIEQYDRQDGK